MGRLKDLMEEGWIAPDKYVCDDCVEEEFFKEILRSEAVSKTCDYCRRQSGVNIAAPTSSILQPIAETVFYYYCEPTEAGVPYDGGWVVEPINTEEVLSSIGLVCNDELFEDISQSFMNDAWVAAANGHWASMHDNDVLRYSWENFVEVVKHQTRYFFNEVDHSEIAGSQEYPPGLVLPAIARVVNWLDLVKVVNLDTRLFRVREKQAGDSWEPNALTMEAPPAEKAAAGRMNPAGISYLYLALEPPTALAEVLQRPPIEAVVAEFRAIQNLPVLDLSELPEIPSIFDSEDRYEREGLLFLKDFVQEVSRPVRKDGKEHVDYVPSQVVCEFFAQAFHLIEDNEKLMGIVYPSSVRVGGKNIVLFPTDEEYEGGFSSVEYVSSETLSITTWSEFAYKIK